MRMAAVVMLLAVTGALAQSTVRERLVGHWRAASNDAGYVRVNNMYFEVGGIFHGVIAAEDGANAWAYRGKWVLAGPWLHYEYFESAHVPRGTKDRDRVIEVNDKHLVIENHEGKKRTYDRCDKSCEAQQGTPADRPRPAGSAGG